MERGEGGLWNIGMLALVRVIRADGRCDRTELHKISRLCNNMNLSTYERAVVMTVGNESASELLKTETPA